MTIELRPPSLESLPQYVDAVQRGWSSYNLRGRVTAREPLVVRGSVSGVRLRISL
jgi:hypothetical protein